MGSDNQQNVGFIICKAVALGHLPQTIVQLALQPIHQIVKTHWKMMHDPINF